MQAGSELSGGLGRWVLFAGIEREQPIWEPYRFRRAGFRSVVRCYVLSGY
jgi:hypothetical protein